MKNIGVSTLVNHNTFFAAFTLLALILVSGSLSSVLAQGKAQEIGRLIRLSRTSQQIERLERLVAEDYALAPAIRQVRQAEHPANATTQRLIAHLIWATETPVVIDHCFISSSRLVAHALQSIKANRCMGPNKTATFVPGARDQNVQSAMFGAG
jgi:hypothetical protein